MDLIHFQVPGNLFRILILSQWARLFWPTQARITAESEYPTFQVDKVQSIDYGKDC